MPLSVKILKGLERSLDDFGDVYISDGSGECLVYLEDVLDAIRELITIKETEPVAFRLRNELGEYEWYEPANEFWLKTYGRPKSDHVWEMTPLIIKPE